MHHLHDLLDYSRTLQDIAEDLCCQSDEIRITATALRHECRLALDALVQWRARVSNGMPNGRPRQFAVPRARVTPGSGIPRSEQRRLGLLQQDLGLLLLDPVMALRARPEDPFLTAVG